MRNDFEGDTSLRKYNERRTVERTTVYNTTAYVKTGISSESGATDIHGIVINLSSHGSCILIHSDFIPEVFSFCRVTIGNHILVPSQIRWIQKVDTGIYKLGIRYQV